jgi:hypothetical protein
MISSYGPGAAGSSAVFGRLIARFQRKYQAFRDLVFGSGFLYEFASWKLVSNGGKDRCAGIEGRPSRPISGGTIVTGSAYRSSDYPGPPRRRLDR